MIYTTQEVMFKGINHEVNMAKDDDNPNSDWYVTTINPHIGKWGDDSEDWDTIYSIAINQQWTKENYHGYQTKETTMNYSDIISQMEDMKYEEVRTFEQQIHNETLEKCIAIVKRSNEFELFKESINSMVKNIGNDCFVSWKGYTGFIFNAGHEIGRIQYTNWKINN